MSFSSSKCPHCQKSAFETAIEEPTGSNFKVIFIRCQSCKTVLGVLDFYNAGVLVKKLAQKLNINLD